MENSNNHISYDILNKDLCARLPYKVKIKYLPDDRLDGIILPYLYNGLTTLQEGNIHYRAHIKNIRPYLRSMSTMTEEERNEYFDFKNQELQRVAFAEVGREQAIAEISDWLNAHHFDYRGLIEKGLAIEAPVDMYKIK